MKIKVLLLMLVVLVGCSNQVKERGSDTGSISIEMSRDISRTVLPDVATITPAKYLLSFTGPSSFNDVELTASSGTIEDVPEGTWTIDVTAYDKDAKIIAVGSKSNIVVTKGNPTEATITIYLQQTSGKSGNTSITLDWTFDTSKADSYTGKIRSIESATYTSIDASKFTYSGNSGKLVYKDNLESGYHIVNINLLDGADLKIPYWEVIHIYDNVESNKEVILTASDFANVFLNPENVTAKETNGGILVTWDDVTNIETGYIVERWLNPSGPWVEIATLPGGSEEYKDTSVSETTSATDKTYKYRVKAKNEFGTSGGSESNEVKWSKPVPGTPSGGTPGELSSSNIQRNSFDLTWTSATDETPGSLGLKYKVVLSKNNDITSVAQANISASAGDKILAMDWNPLPTTMPYEVAGLEQNTTYYVNVLVKDEAENIISYIESTATPPAPYKVLQVKTLEGPGSIDVTITVEAINDLNIKFIKADGSEINDRDLLMANGTLALTTTEVYSDYIWIVDNYDLSAGLPSGITITPAIGTSKSEILTIGPNTLDIGLRTITLICKKDGKSYSDSISLIFGN